MRAARLVLIAAFVAACGSAGALPGNTAAPPAQQPRLPSGTGSAGGVCFLVTDAEIAGIMGRALMAGGSGFELGGVRFCNWPVNLDPLEAAGITVSSAASHDQERFDPWEPVSGLGDDAYWMPGLFLSVRSGAHRLTASVTSETVDPKAASVSLARIALGRLR